MKTPVVLLALTVAATAAFFSRTGTPVRVCGIVSDLETGKPLAGAEVRQNGGSGMVLSDSLGRFCLLIDTALGTQLQAAKGGYHSFTMRYRPSEGAEVISIALAHAETEKDLEGEGTVFRATRVYKDLSGSTTRTVAVPDALRREDAAVITHDDHYSEDISIGTSMAPPIMDGPEPAYREATHKVSHTMLRSGGSRISPEEPQPRSGLLTAGEINDFSKWKLWEDLDSSTFALYAGTWQFRMKERYSVQLINNANRPVCDARVQLLDKKGKVLWEAKSDNTGKAELWNGTKGMSQEKPASIRAEYKGRTSRTDYVVPIAEGMNYLQMDAPCEVPLAADIVFVVDATGSMGDEITYLKQELDDVIKRASAGSSLKLRTGSVFYRDHGDEYLVRHSPLSATVSQTMNFIRSQGASGGGDGPEAVEEGLEQALKTMEWSAEARTRLMFLILDAAPHTDTASVRRMQAAAAKAAAMGVRIIPVTASGIDKSAEYLMRSLALATNGTYTFITNHSGIGGHHIEPSTDSYKVELLNNLLVRLIRDYSSMPSCEEGVAALGLAKEDLRDTVITWVQPNGKDSLVRPQGPGNQDSLQAKPTASKEWAWKFYPNPCPGMLHVETKGPADFLFFCDQNGKVLQRIDMREKSAIEMDLRQYPAGIYYVRISHKIDTLSGKLVLLPIVSN
jgi:hypothetical protein